MSSGSRSRSHNLARVPDGTADATKNRSASKFGVISSYVLFAVIAGAPLPFGSDNPPAIACWCIVLGLAAVAASLSMQELQVGHRALLGGIIFIVIFYVFVLHEQLADHPWLAAPHPVWAQASKALGTTLTPSDSITRGEPFFALGAPLASLLALTCGLFVGADRDRAYQVLRVVAWSGVAYAAYGVLSFLIEPTTILWREKRDYIGSVTGTFINRNTAAAYFGSCAVVWFTLLLDQVRRHVRTGKLIWKKVPQRLLTKTPGAVIISFSMLFICLMAMFLTGSRAGVVLSLFALIITFTVFFRSDLPRRTGIWVALAGGAAVALILLEFMGGAVSNRFDVQALSDEGRLAAYASTLHIVADHPWFGTGLGTFAWSFPAYRSPDVSMLGVWDIAHNTPLELASEVGLPLAGAVCFGWVVMLAVLIHGVRTRRRDVIIPLAALSVSIIAILHSCVDFSLQMPGYAIVVFALVGAGLAQSFGARPPGNGVLAQESPMN